MLRGCLASVLYPHYNKKNDYVQSNNYTLFWEKGDN